MKSSIATVSISGSLPEKLEAISAAGFDGVEIFENDLLVGPDSPRAIRRICADLGLEICLFQPFRDFEGLPEPQRKQAFDRAKRKFELMNELGTDLILICSNVSPFSIGGIDRAAVDLHELGDVARDFGVRVGYEALAWGRFVNDHRDAWEVVRRAEHDSIGLILDSYHTLARGIDPETIRSIPGDRIFIVQLADAPRLQMDLLYLSRHFRNMPAQGDLPVTEFLRAVLATGYSGYVSLEVFNDQFRGTPPRAIALDGKRSITHLVDAAMRAEPSSVPAKPLPPRAQVQGMSFVEFSSSPRESAQLSSQFRTMGFECTARHRSKEVDLFAQGNIRLVLNTEVRGLTFSNFLTHGTSAYAIGLEVDDAGAALDRAVALGAQVFDQQVQPGELLIPAIRGVGGSLIYLLDRKGDLARVWETEFTPEHTPRARPALSGIDHIAQTMNYNELLTWILYYGSIFETTKSPMVDVTDPGGLVRSQVIENNAGSLRLTFNGAENDRTFAGRFIRETFGSGIQHIALSCSDIFHTARELARSGFRALKVSPNYYADLQSRFGLDDALTGRLSEHALLYDREPSGEFFQLFGQADQGGFFFEVVERRNYRGYGAANAPFRIAAQRQAAVQEIAE